MQMIRRASWAATLLVLVLLASACASTVSVEELSGQGGVPEIVDTVDETVDGVDTTDDGPADAAPAEEEGPEPTPVVPTGDEVYRTTSPSVVFVEAPDQFGSGFVIEGGWIVTNEHVVARWDEVRIGLADGTDFGMVPVAATDPVLDLALVGPVDGLPAIAAGDSTAMKVGDPVYLVGFPDETSMRPLASLTQGVVSNRRRIALGDFPFMQVDALIAPGQSGGALVDEDGALVGISGLSFGQGAFGLVLESDPMWRRVDLLKERAANAAPLGEAVFEFSEEVGQNRYAAVMVEADEIGGIALEIDSPGDLFVELVTLSGFTYYGSFGPVDYFDGAATVEGSSDQYFVDGTFSGIEELDVTAEPGRYLVLVGPADAGETVGFTMTSQNPLYLLPDDEEGRKLPVGETIEGELGWLADSDRWSLPLTEGQQVTIVADGIADTIVVVRLDGEFIASSDDAGIGMFGTGSEVRFEAPGTGDYVVEVGTFDDSRGGYLIEVAVE